MRSKRYRRVLSVFEPQKKYELREAIKILQENNFENSDNFELSFSLNWNIKQNSIRDYIIVPYPVKKEALAIIDVDVPLIVRERNDIKFISLEDLPTIIAKKKKKNWGFSKLFAHSSIASKLKPFARSLSAKKSFPNLKDGTLVDDIELAVNLWDRGKIELRNDKWGNFHVLLGKSSFDQEQIDTNYKAFLQKIFSLKPSNWRGEYLKSITVSTTMGPGIRILV